MSAVVDVTHPGLRATAIATVALFNNLLGLAPGPYVVGVLSDSIGLKSALTIVPVAGLVRIRLLPARGRQLRAGRGGEGLRVSIASAARASAPGRDRRG